MTDPATGEVVCISCGTVISDKMLYTGPEWRVLTSDEFNSRSMVGKPMSLAIHDLGLSTVIGRNSKDCSGKTIIDSSSRSIIERIRIWDYRTQTRGAKEYGLKFAFRNLNKLCLHSM
jgi:transcription initiation factor TFIIB